MLKVTVFRNRPAGVQASNVLKKTSAHMRVLFFFNMTLGYVSLINTYLTKFNIVKNFHLPP